MQNRAPIITNCEKAFIQSLLDRQQRLDGRKFDQFRPLGIHFADTPGGVTVSLGDTKVFAQVSCDFQKPHPSKPNEGILIINLEFSPLAGEGWGRGNNPYALEVNRILERCLREAIDVESLCIVAGETVWCVRADLHVLCHGGNVIDCSSIAAISALAHFQRPDVSVETISVATEGDVFSHEFNKIRVHSGRDRESLSLNVQHYPVCVTLGLGTHSPPLLDPTSQEEEVMEGRMVVAANNHGEICSLHMTGGVTLETRQVLSCTQLALKTVAENLIPKIQTALAVERNRRQSKINTASSVKTRKQDKEVADIPSDSAEKTLAMKSAWSREQRASLDKAASQVATSRPVLVKVEKTDWEGIHG